jgi:septal ring factor EnvC (AmiA/AmiB activator)
MPSPQPGHSKFPSLHWNRRASALALLLLGGGLLGSSALAAPALEWIDPGAQEPTALPGGDDFAAETQRLQTHVQDLKRESRELHAITIARGRAYVRLSRAGLMPLSGGFEALSAHASRLQRLRRALARDLARDRQIDARRVEAARMLRDLEEMPPRDRDAKTRARTAILAAEERELAFQRAFQGGFRGGGSTAVYGAQVAPIPEAAGFAAQRGRLPFPLAGRSEIQKLRSPSGTGKALLMRTNGGAAVRAVYPGRVAFADDYPSLGRTVIIDHGDRFYTVSSHLDRIAVQAGDELSSGQRIGTVGMYEHRPALLFEVRAGQSTVDTPEWFGI